MSPFKDPEKRKAYAREFYNKQKKDPEFMKKKREKSRKHYQKHREKELERTKIYREKNAEKVKEQQKKYSQSKEGKEVREKYKNDPIVKERMREWKKNYNKRKYYSDLDYKLKHVLRVRMTCALKRNQKSGSAIKDLGCTGEELRVYLENQFEDGMSWDNWSRDGWHIDHKKPLDSFDLTDPEQFKEAVHYTNLKPLWAFDNLSKGNKTDYYD